MPGTRFDVRRFDSIDSTNRYLIDEARAGAPSGVVAVADHQTAGRGRLGRRWEAPAGANLLLSVLLRPVLDPVDRHLVTTAVALAAVDAVAEVVPDAVVGTGNGPTVAVKWPNDLVTTDGRKLAGVLAEADLMGGPDDRPAPVVVGIGVNVNWPASDQDLPAELQGSASSLRQLTGGPVNREALLTAILAALGPRVDALDTPHGRADLAADLRAVCSTIGTTVRVELPEGILTGTATGISDEGHLMVEVEGVTRAVVAGDVVHVRSAS